MYASFFALLQFFHGNGNGSRVDAFNAEGLYLPGSNTRKSDSKKLSRWQDILKKMHAEGFAVGEG